MKIIECYVENFGKISNKKFTFKDGINTCLSDNGSGKTTLSVFIKAMLYGLSDTKKVSLDENERKRYMPWQGGVAGGYMTFDAMGGRYRIERTFGAKASEDSCKIYDLSTGKESDRLTEPIGEGLFGIDAEGFERTVFLSERNMTPKSDNKSIAAKLSNLVGADFDIGVMDSAMKVLEERRKFYHKKGGGGEIAELKGKISSLELKISEAERSEEEILQIQKRISGIRSLLNQNKQARNELDKIRDKSASLIAKKARLEQRQAILNSISESERRQKSLVDFFGGRVPTFDEIDAVGYKLTKAKNLSEQAEEKNSEEYLSLKEYFDKKTDSSEIDNVKNALSRVKKKQSVPRGAREERANQLFKKRTPNVQETDSLIKALSNPKRSSYTLSIMALVVGVFALALGAFLGVLVSPILYTLAIGAVLSLCVPIFYLAKRKKEGKHIDNMSREFFSSLSDYEPDKSEYLPLLIEINALLQSVYTGCENDMNIICDFVRRFPEEEGDACRATETILKKHERLRELTIENRIKNEAKEKSANEAEELKSEANNFLAQFKAVSDEPINELRSALIEYNSLREHIASKQRELCLFSTDRDEAIEEGLENVLQAEELESQKSSLYQEAESLNREYTLLERRLADISEILESKDELSAKKEELVERYERYSKNLKTILLTKKFLEKAKDNLTTRYLGKTKKNFDSYVKHISGAENDEFYMDTSFGVKKREGATARVSEAYSRGTRDLYNLAARFALIDSLYEDEEPFVILDDPFVNLDDEKIRAALELLSTISKDRQIIYFTCSKSRAIRA